MATVVLPAAVVHVVPAADSVFRAYQNVCTLPASAGAMRVPRALCHPVQKDEDENGKARSFFF